MSFTGTPDEIVAYDFASPKLCRGPDGLLRYAPHNLIASSKGYGQNWENTGSVTATEDAAQAPDGSMTATKLEFGSNESSWLEVSNEASRYRNTAFSIWIKGENGKQINIGYGEGDQVLTCQLNGEWQRFEIEHESGNNPWIGTWDLEDNIAFEVYIWGAQLRRLPSPDTFVATSGSPKATLPYEWDENGNPLGIRCEYEKTNICVESEIYPNWSTWELVIVPGDVEAPNGQLKSTLLRESNTLSIHITELYCVVDPSFDMTVSVFAKAKDRRYLSVGLAGSDVSGDNWFAAVFDLEEGTVTKMANGSGDCFVLDAHIEPYANGWYRLSVTGWIDDEDGWIELNPTPTDDPTYTFYAQIEYQGAELDAAYVWGAQLEYGYYPTSLIETYGVEATRVFDAPYVDASLFPHGNEMTVYCKFRNLPYPQEIQRIVGMADDSSAMEVGNDWHKIGTWNSNVEEFLELEMVDTTADFVKAALAYDTQGRSLAGTGMSSIASDSNGGYPLIDAVRLGWQNSWESAGHLHIAEIMVLPRKMSDGELESLVTS